MSSSIPPLLDWSSHPPPTYANKGITLNFDSHHSSATNTAVVHNELGRANICSATEHLQQAIEATKNKLIRNGYPKSLLDANQKRQVKHPKDKTTTEARSSHRFEGSNEPPFVRQVSFFFLVRFTSAPCLVITRRLCRSNKDERNLVAVTGGDCEQCAVRWASARPRLRCDQRRPSSLALPQAYGWCTKKKTALDVSAFFILLDRSARSVSLLQGPAKHDETNEGIRHGRTSRALFFRF